MSLLEHTRTEEEDFKDLLVTKLYLDELRRNVEFGRGIWWSPSFSLALLNVGKHLGDDNAYNAARAITQVRADSIEKVFLGLQTLDETELRAAYERVVSGAYRAPELPR